MNNVADRTRFGTASQLAILRSCPEVLQRLLRKRGSVLLGAKVLVLSRLLHTKLAEHARIHEYIGGIRSRLAKLRQRLLAVIDRKLKSPHTGSEELLETMCAFSLATSSSTRDVLRHFHHVRSDGICNYSSLSSEPDLYILEALRLWIRTLQDTKAIFPRQLANALIKLKSTPLFKDQSLWSNAQFDYEVHAMWITDDLKNFIPYIRHDDLDSSAAAEHLASWAPHILNGILQNINAILGSIVDPRVIVQLRRRCIELWISSRHNSIGTDKAEVLDGLRDTFRARLLHLIETHCSALKEISSSVAATTKNLNPVTLQACQNLWKKSLLPTDVSAGAKGFTSALVSNVSGASEGLRLGMKSYHEWLSLTEDWNTVIKELQGTRWDDNLEVLEDDDNLDEKLQDLLSKEDPQSLRTALAQSLVASFVAFENTIRDHARSLEDNASFDIKALFLLRTLRTVRQHLPKAYTNATFAVTVIDELQSQVSEYVIQTVLPSHDVSGPTVMESSRSLGRALWDSAQELPVLPSPWTCKLLRALQLKLADIGPDLWSSAAIAKLKVKTRASLAASLSRQPESKYEVNGHEQQPPTSPRMNQIDINGLPEDFAPYEPEAVDSAFKVQLLFDITYLAEATSTASGKFAEDEFGNYCSKVEHESTLSGASAMQVKKNAVDYWKRTSLLYAFLA